MPTISLEIEYKWVPVESEPGQVYVFPNNLSIYLKKHYALPAIYRWVLEDTQVYIGETENLVERIKGYLRPGPSQTTNQRMNKILTDATLDLLMFESTNLQNKTIAIDDLFDKPTRRLLESLFIVYHTFKGHKTLNL